ERDLHGSVLRRVELIAGGYGDRDDWLDALRRNAARGGIPDAQWPPVSLHRPRSRRRCAGPPRSVSCERRRRAGGDLPGRRRASESEQSADSRLPRLQRCDRPHTRPRPGDRGRRPCIARARGVRRIGRAGCARPRIESARGQAGSSSRIEYYLGFPTGISGIHLTGRAYAQAQKFGGQVMMANGAAKLACARPLYAVHLEDGGRVDARALIIASGAQYRRPAIANLSKFEGAGVYYAAFRMESQLCVGEEVVIVDGGNSAGQAAVFLADAAMLVQLLVRKDGLADTMSRYLIRRIDDHPAITLHTQAELVALDGDRHLARVQWGDTGTGVVETRDIRHVFMMTGAVPNTKWLEGCVALDQRGFIKTGPGLFTEDLTTAS